MKTIFVIPLIAATGSSGQSPHYGQNHHSQSGYTLIEVVVTLAISVLGLAGIAALQLQVDRSTQDAGGRTQGVWMVEDLTNRIRANIAAVASYDTAGAVVDCSTPPVTWCADSYNGAAKTSADGGCTSVALAAFDLWDVACSAAWQVSGSTFTRKNLSDYLANPQLIVTYSNTGVTDNININLSWDARSGGTNEDGDAVYADSADITDRRVSIVSEFTP